MNNRLWGPSIWAMSEPVPIWTRPYSGVSHLLSVDDTRAQATIEEQGKRRVEAYVLLRGSFTPVAEATFTRVEPAKVWLWRRCRDLGLLK